MDLKKLMLQVVTNQGKGQEAVKTSPSITIEEANKRFVVTATRLVKGFEIDGENEPVILDLLGYFSGNKTSLDPSKGICLMGNVGSGKTKLMEIFNLCKFPNKEYGLKECRDLSEKFLNEHYKGINYYGKGAVSTHRKSHMCFDDLGAENDINYYGNKVNVMADVLIDRYKHFTDSQLMTHVTTNLTKDEIESQYGTRVLSRMNQMFNFVTLGGKSNSKDRRING